MFESRMKIRIRYETASQLNVVFMAVYVPPEYEKKGGAKAFANKIIDMIEGFVREKRLNQSGRQDLNLRPLRPERSALAKLSYSPAKQKHKIAHQLFNCKLQ